jgi:Domain of unknown function (DUF6378)/Domain of unknown function (DUF4406)
MPEYYYWNVYISGPMTDVPEFNYPQFNEVEELIRISHKPLPDVKLPKGDKWRVVPFNPARNFEGQTDLSREVYLELALRQVDTCQAIVLLPRWYQSPGARLELVRAMHNGADVYSYCPLARTDDEYFQRIEHDEARFTLRRTAQPAMEGVADDFEDMRAVATMHLLKAASDAGIAAVGGETIEQEASRLVRNGERQQNYGHPRGDFDQIALYWTADLAGKLENGITVNAYDVAQMMISLKKARLKSNPHHRDSKVDIIGYTICHDRLDEPLPEKAA